MVNGVGVLGDAEPKFQMSTYNEITFFGKLSLRFLIHWKQGGDNINLTSLENDFGGTSPDYDNVTNKQGVPDAIYRIIANRNRCAEYLCRMQATCVCVK